MSAAPLLVVLKSHVRAYQRTTKNGKVVQVHEHEDQRMRHAQPAAGSEGPRAPASSGPGMGHNGGPPMEDKPARAASPPGHEAQRIPTRLMGEIHAKKAGHDRNDAKHTIGMAEMRANPKLWEHNVGLLRHYPGTPDDMRGAPADQLAEHTVNRWKENLLWLHDQVPEETRQRSKLWYDGARKITDEWSGKYGLHPASVAGAIAALSPQKDWYQNVSCAQRVIEAMTANKDHRWDDAMSKRVSEIPAMAKYPEVVKAVEGKTYAELSDPLDKAFWVRAYDETNNAKSYPVLSPEGDAMGEAQKKNPDKKTGKTESRDMAWGSLVEIKKAILSIEANGDLSKISPLMGEEHKVRNFYNNIVAPHSANGEITSDTHAVAAAELRPLAGSDEAVVHNFGSSMPQKAQDKLQAREGRGFVAAKSDASGVSGTYGLMADAYRRAAKERGILPREMQSITWEAVRGLFEDTWKKDGNRAKVDAIWKDASAGKIGADEARKQIHGAAGGITPPTWHPEHPANRGGAGEGGGAGRPGVDEGQGRGPDAGGVRGPELGRGEDGGRGDGGARAGEPDTSVAAAGGRGGDDFGAPREVEPEPPAGPKVVMHQGREYEFQHHDKKSGVAVRGRGKLATWGPSGVLLVGEGNQQHKVPWSSLSPQDKAEIEAQGKPKGNAKAGSSVRKAGGPLVVLRKSDDGSGLPGGDFLGVPVVVIGMAAGASADMAAQAAQGGEAPPPAEDPGPPQPRPEEEPEAGGKDPRFSYAGMALRALRNFWRPAG